jgi:phospholipid transport system substrate-binding protein
VARIPITESDEYRIAIRKKAPSKDVEPQLGCVMERKPTMRSPEGMMMLKSLRGIGLAITLLIMVATPPTVKAEEAQEATLPVPQQEAAAIDTTGEPISITETSSPRPTIETFHGGLIEIMKQAKVIGFQGRIDRLAPLMAETFDLDFMASKTVGGHWRKLSDADKKRWTEVFTRITVANYAGRFTGYTGEEFITTDVEEAKRGQKVVLTKIVIPEDEDVQLNYRLRKTETGWKVIDVYLNGTVSELALRRSEYSTALKREGFEELVASIETKIEDMKAKALVDG